MPALPAQRPSLRFMLSRPHHALSLSFGAGLVPVAPGTVGALVGFPLFWALQQAAPAERAVLYAALFLVGTWACHLTGRALGFHDHPAIVWDETLAMSFVLEFTPAGYGWWAGAFLLFRLFDIVKPWPANLPDRKGNSGLSAMLDDALAGLYAVLAILILRFAVEGEAVWPW